MTADLRHELATLCLVHQQLTRNAISKPLQELANDPAGFTLTSAQAEYALANGPKNVDELYDWLEVCKHIITDSTKPNSRINYLARRCHLALSRASFADMCSVFAGRAVTQSLPPPSKAAANREVASAAQQLFSSGINHFNSGSKDDWELAVTELVESHRVATKLDMQTLKHNSLFHLRLCELQLQKCSVERVVSSLEDVLEDSCSQELADKICVVMSCLRDHKPKLRVNIEYSSELEKADSLFNDAKHAQALKLYQSLRTRYFPQSYEPPQWSFNAVGLDMHDRLELLYRMAVACKSHHSKQEAFGICEEMNQNDTLMTGSDGVLSQNEFTFPCKIAHAAIQLPDYDGELPSVQQWQWPFFNVEALLLRYKYDGLELSDDELAQIFEQGTVSQVKHLRKIRDSSNDIKFD